MLREGTTLAGIPSPLDIDQILGVAISHLHADHACGLEDFGFYCYYTLGRPAKLLMHPEVSARAWDGLLAAGMELVQEGPDQPPARQSFEQFFELTALDESRPVSFGPFSIRCRRTIHSVPTTAFKIQAGGRTIGISSDTAYDPTLIDWLSESDLIIHEATSLKESALHTPYEKLAALPESLRARMRLTHYSDDFELGSSVIEPLRQGLCYTL